MEVHLKMNLFLFGFWFNLIEFAYQLVKHKISMQQVSKVCAMLILEIFYIFLTIVGG